MNLFKKKKYVPVTLPVHQTVDTPVVPDGAWLKCPCCGKTIYNKELDVSKVCPYCGGCFRLTAWERIEIISDKNTFSEWDKNMSAQNSMDYPGYEKKISNLQETTGLKDAVVTGSCEIGAERAVLCVMDSHFIMGSMGAVVGEKITRAFERASEHKLPVVVFTTSGGARMQEGILSLMQMAKVSAAVARHSEKGLLYITVLTDPTTGGVTASFAMQGDIILAEPKATVGFAGRRVIEQTIKQKLPEDFQTSEFLLEHGFVDKIVPRKELKEVLTTILRIHHGNGR